VQGTITSTARANATGGSSESDGGPEEKVIMCHSGQTIEVAQSAVQAHLDHGDTLGPCEEVIQ